jgi:ankyrin repeat protein
MGKTQEIHLVCLNGNMKRFNEIIKDVNFRINAKDNINFTPIMCASFSGNIKMVRKLLTMDKLNINARSRNGKTALIIAATRGHINVVKLLLDNGANPNLKQFKNSKKPCKPKTALDMSLQCHHKKVSKFLKSKKAKKTGAYKYWKPK